MKQFVMIIPIKESMSSALRSSGGGSDSDKSDDDEDEERDDVDWTEEKALDDIGDEDDSTGDTALEDGTAAFNDDLMIGFGNDFSFSFFDSSTCCWCCAFGATAVNLPTSLDVDRVSVSLAALAAAASSGSAWMACSASARICERLRLASRAAAATAAAPPRSGMDEADLDVDDDEVEVEGVARLSGSKDDDRCDEDEESDDNGMDCDRC